MRKKIISLALATVLSMSLLVGCGGDISSGGNADIIQEETETASQEERTINKTEENSEIEIKGEISSEATSSEISAVEATLDKPAEIGEWVETKRYAAEDGEYHTVYVKVTDVIRGDEAKKIVDEYNSEGHSVVINDLEQEELEYCIVTYESYFPTDYPQADYGITSVDVDLSACNLQDSGAIAGYIGLSSVWDISDEPEINEFYAGDTFKDGKAVFAMVKDHTEYLFRCSYYDENDTRVAAYIKGK